MNNRIAEKSFFEFLTRTPKEQGFLALWRGNEANCWLYLWQVGIQFFCYENINSYWRWQTTSVWEKSLANLCNVVTASAATLLVTYPIETARVRISNQFHAGKGDSNAYRGIVDAMMAIRSR